MGVLCNSRDAPLRTLVRVGISEKVAFWALRPAKTSSYQYISLSFLPNSSIPNCFLFQKSLRFIPRLLYDYGSGQARIQMIVIAKASGFSERVAVCASKSRNGCLGIKSRQTGV